MACRPVERYLSVVVEVADQHPGHQHPGHRFASGLGLRIASGPGPHSGGSVVDPPVAVHDCRDHEDNRVLDLAVDVGALLVVSDDADLASMSPWRGTPILRPREFAAKVDGMRRHRRR